MPRIDLPRLHVQVPSLPRLVVTPPAQQRNWEHGQGVDADLELALRISLESYLAEERARAAQKKEVPLPQEVLTRNIPARKAFPSGEVCTLMAEEIPPLFGIYINGDPFDLRYLLKGSLVLSRPNNPYTRAPFEPDQLTEICTALGISSAEFNKIWEHEEQTRTIQQQVNHEFDDRLRGLQIAIQFARFVGGQARIDQLTREYAQFLLQRGGDPKARVAELTENLRKKRFMDLLRQAQLHGLVPPEYTAGFATVLFPQGIP